MKLRRDQVEALLYGAFVMIVLFGLLAAAAINMPWVKP